MTRTKNKVTQELEAARKVVERGGTADIKGLEEELQNFKHQREYTKGELIAQACGKLASTPATIASVIGCLSHTTECCQFALDTHTFSVPQCDQIAQAMKDIDTAQASVTAAWKRIETVIRPPQPVSLKTPKAPQMEVSIL